MSSVVSPPLLTEEILDQIHTLGKKRMPAEACGFLFPQLWRGKWLVEMPNRADRPHNSFRFSGGDASVGLEDWFRNNDHELWNQLTVWHTHPGGGIGPSRLDMVNKFSDAFFLVVTLNPDDTTTATWY